MAEITTASPRARRLLTIAILVGSGLVLIGLVFVAVNAVVSGRAGLQSAPGANQNEVGLEYTTEGGKGVNEGVVDSPLSISIRLPKVGGDQEESQTTTMAASVSIQLFDEQGNPAVFGGSSGWSCAMRPTYESDVWICSGSVPSREGAYHARVVVEPRQSGSGAQEAQPQRQVYAVSAPILTAKAESGPPVSSGYVFAKENNLWMLSTDAKKERRLTFFLSSDEYADSPAWSPDGNLVAYAYSPKVNPQDIPATDIWTINSDGSGARQLVAHSPDESLLDPAWSPDGRYLYFTVETSAMASTIYDASGVPVGDRRIDCFDMQTGKRTQWMLSAMMLDGGDKSGNLVYLEDVPGIGSQESGVGNGTLSPTPNMNSAASLHQRLVRVKADGSAKAMLVADNAYPAINTPSTSPDGRWVAFAAIGVPNKGGHELDFLAWLGLKPGTAFAHGLPWELYVVSTDGGSPVQVTNMREDQPRPVWLDNTTLAFMGTYGLYTLQIDGSGKPTGTPAKIHTGAPHGGLTWHGP